MRESGVAISNGWKTYSPKGFSLRRGSTAGGGEARNPPLPVADIGGCSANEATSFASVNAAKRLCRIVRAAAALSFNDHDNGCCAAYTSSGSQHSPPSPQGEGFWRPFSPTIDNCCVWFSHPTIAPPWQRPGPLPVLFQQLSRPQHRFFVTFFTEESNVPLVSSLLPHFIVKLPLADIDNPRDIGYAIHVTKVLNFVIIANTLKRKE